IKTGERHDFVCLQIDIVKHSELRDSERILHEVKQRFLKHIEGKVRAYDGQLLRWEGDGGAFMFLSADSHAFNEAVFAAFEILEGLPRINDELRIVHELRRPLSVRISLDN